MPFQLLFFAVWLFCLQVLGSDLRVGIIGCDTSHVPRFTEILNNPQAKDHVSGAKVVAAFKGGSKDIESSWSRVEGYSRTLQERYGVRIYDTIEEMCSNVDAVLIESSDGRVHLSQAKAVIGARKPMYIDKPMAAALGDVITIFRLAKETGVPVFSTSSLRYGKDTQAAAHGAVGKITYAETFSSCQLEPHHPDLFWYGVHGVEALFTIMGTDCESVQRGTTKDGKIEVIGFWSGERKGIFREDKSFHGLVKGEKGEATAGSFNEYAPLVAEIIKFFQTGVSPVLSEETITIFAFMEAADESKRLGGAPVPLKRILEKARL